MKKFWILAIITCLLLLNTYGQDLDSDQKNQEKTSLVYNTIDSLNILSRDLTFIDTKKSMESAQAALDLSVEHNYEIGKAYAYRNLSNLNIINEIYSLGMDYIQKALDIFRNQNDSIGIADCYISLGHLYRGLHNAKDEVKYFELAFDQFVQLNIQSRIGVAAHNLGESYYLNGDYDNSRKLTLFAIKTNKSIGQTSVLSSCYKVMGLLEFSNKNYDTAEEYFRNALNISEQLGENSQKVATVESMIELASIYKIRNQSNLQLSLLDQATEFSKKYNLSSYLPKIYNEMVLHYSLKNNHEMVQRYISDYNNIIDRITTQNLKDKNDLVNSLIYLHTIEKEKRFLEETERLQTRTIHGRNIFLIIILISFSLLAWFAIKLKRVNNKFILTNQTLKSQNETIKSQNSRLEVLISTRDRLFSIIAHDLRSPFNTILGFSELLIENLKDFKPAEIIKYIKYINNNATSTLDLLENLLDWAKNQTGQMDFNPKNLKLNPLIKEVVVSLEPSSLTKDIHLCYTPLFEVEVYADNNLLKTILRNLIQNSIKFTHNGGKIEIFVEKKQKQIEISVTDNGVGMSAAIKNNLFLIDKTKINKGTADEKGSGLGLVLCREFVEKHKGKIWVKSKKGQGSTFSFTIPAKS